MVDVIRRIVSHECIFLEFTFSDIPNCKSNWIFIDNFKTKYDAKVVKHSGNIITLNCSGQFVITLDVETEIFYIDYGYEREI